MIQQVMHVASVITVFASREHKRDARAVMILYSRRGSHSCCTSASAPHSLHNAMVTVDGTTGAYPQKYLQLTVMPNEQSLWTLLRPE